MTAEWLAGNIAAHWIQAGVLAVSALIAIRLLNLNEPRARLAALHVTLVAIVLLPLLQPWTAIEPALEVTSSAIVSSAAPVHTLEAAQGGIEATSWPDPSLAIVAIVMAGMGMRLLWLLLRHHPTQPIQRSDAGGRCRRRSQRDFEAALGVSPRYIQQTGSRGPWTFGFLRPTIALPAGFDALVPAFQRAVICHELVHIKRRDIAVAFVEELAVAALWFHPWMWLLRARIRVAREQVVDSRVVTMLGNRDDYVRCLVDLSGHDLAPHFSQAGAGMLRPRELRARVDAIFQEVHMSRMRFAVAASVVRRRHHCHGTDCHCGDAAARSPGRITSRLRRLRAPTPARATPPAADQQGLSGVPARRARARNQRGRHRRYHRECGWRCQHGRGRERTSGVACLGVQGRARHEVHDGSVHNGDADHVRICAHRHDLGREDRRGTAEHGSSTHAAKRRRRGRHGFEP